MAYPIRVFKYSWLINLPKDQVSRVGKNVGNVFQPPRSLSEKPDAVRLRC